jgi:hypothetical protein
MRTLLNQAFIIFLFMVSKEHKCENKSICLGSLNDIALRDVDTVQELAKRRRKMNCLAKAALPCPEYKQLLFLYISKTRLTLRISLFLTRVACWMLAARKTIEVSENSTICHHCDMESLLTRLGDSIEVVTSDDQLILLGRGDLNTDTFQHLDTESDLLTQEVTDLNFLTIIVNNNINGKMGIYVTHLVFETLGNTGDHVVNNGSDSADASNVLAVAVVDDELELVLTNGLDLHVEVAQVLGKLAAGALDGDNAGLDVNFNTLGNDELVVLVNVLQEKRNGRNRRK